MGEKLAETWLDHRNQISESISRIDDFCGARKTRSDIQIIVQKEIASSARSEMRETYAVVEKKILFDLRPYSETDFAGLSLTDYEKVVIKMRLVDKRFLDIDRKTDKADGSAYQAFKRVMKKYNRYLTVKKMDLGTDVSNLTDQQIEICKLQKLGLKQLEISSKMGISIGTLKKQLNRIREKGKN